MKNRYQAVKRVRQTKGIYKVGLFLFVDLNINTDFSDKNLLIAVTYVKENDHHGEKSFFWYVDAGKYRMQVQLRKLCTILNPIHTYTYST